jgi:hypothetical protein
MENLVGRGTVNMSSPPVRNRFDCLDITVTNIRRNLLEGSNVTGVENAPSRPAENRSKRPLVKSSKEELESEAGLRK